MNLFKTLVAAVAVTLAVPFVAAADDAPGVFKIPGTDSTIKFYGYTQLDITEDFSGRVGDIEDNDWATFLPSVPNDQSVAAKKMKPQLYMTARTSRFGLQTNTPTKLGAVGVKLEGDFNAPSYFQSETFTNSVGFRLRHAYGTVGGLLVGQTWSTFLDLGAAPDTVDFNGPGSLALVRNPMIRYTATFAPGVTLALAAENARGTQYGGTKYQVLPDFHANLGYSSGWGHISLRGVTQQYDILTSSAGTGTTSSAFGASGAVSGDLKIGGDTLVAQFSGGPGVGRYLLNASGATQNNVAPADGGTAAWKIGGNPGGFVYDANGKVKLINVYAYHVGYTHVWNPEFRSNVVWSQTFINDPKPLGVEADNTFEKEMSQAFVNTFWSFAKNAEFGLEYVYGQWKSFTGGASPELKGTMNRVNASFHYNFY